MKSTFFSWDQTLTADLEQRRILSDRDVAAAAVEQIVK